MYAVAFSSAQETLTQKIEQVSETVHQFGASCLYRLRFRNSNTWKSTLVCFYLSSTLYQRK